MRDEGLGHYVPSIAIAASKDFGDLLDFIWKSPDFIKSALKRERGKIDFDIPEDASDDFRIKAETYIFYVTTHDIYRVENTFPSLLNAANIFISASLFEFHLAKICRHAEKVSLEKISDQRGQGYAKCTNYLDKIGINRKRLDHFREANSAVVIRNCLMHAGGLLELSRDRKQIEHIVRNSEHLTDYTRARNRTSDAPYAALTISDTEEGPKLIIPDQYPHIAAAALRDHLVAITAEIEQWLNAMTRPKTQRS